MRSNQAELYAKDHWQMRPNLSVSAGLRYQYMPGIYERHNRIATFDPSRYDPALAPQIDSKGNLVPGTGLRINGMPAVGILQAGVDGTPRSLYRTPGNNFGPRLGFNWDPWHTGRTMVRGGFGVFYDRPVTNSTRDQGASPPFVRTVEISAGSVCPHPGGVCRPAPPRDFAGAPPPF